MKWTRQHTQAGVAALIAAGIGTWFVLATEWVDVTVPPELRGPAKTDPLYAFKGFTKALGVELSTPDNLDRLPPPGATLVLSSWFWDLFPERNDALQKWVRNGGHLVVPSYEYVEETLAWTTITSVAPPTPERRQPPARDAASAPGDDSHGARSGRDDDPEDDEDREEDDPPGASSPSRTGPNLPAQDAGALLRGEPADVTSPAPDVAPDAAPDAARAPAPHLPPRMTARPARLPETSPLSPRRRRPNCPRFVEPASVAPAFGKPRSYTTCAGTASTLRSGLRAQWAIDNSRGHVMLRVPLGKGSVTASNPRLAIYGTSLLENDDALLLVAALRLERGQQLWLVTDEKRPPLLAVLWNRGAPVILLGAAALALALWRNGVRFGPRMAAAPLARRSVGEQIRGTAAFIAHHRGLPLHRAQLRALDACARARVPGYDALIVGERAAALAPLVGIDTHTLARAMNPELSRHLPSALGLLETARRRLLLNPTPAADAPRPA